MFRARFGLVINIVLPLMAILCFCIPSYCQDISKGEQLFQKAQQDWDKAYYTKAGDLYRQAKEQFIKENNPDRTRTCQLKIFDITKITEEYPFTYEDLVKEFKKEFKGFQEKDLEQWVKDGWVDHIMINGQPRYFGGCLDNLQYRHPEIRKKFPDIVKEDRERSATFLNFFPADPSGGLTYKKTTPYIKPCRFLTNMKLEIPRRELPKTGLLKIWFPYPVQTACQTDIELIKIVGEEYWKSGPRTDMDIGTIYFEIPLDQLESNLDLQVQYVYKSYQRYFQIEPENVGEYDKESALYKLYTASGQNIALTPEIREKAQKIVGDETNPYLQAHKIYNYIVENVKYSYMPHCYLDVLGISESQYVHQNQYGDCGAQSSYFCALCRSLGIPARCTGGYQVWIKGGSPHFWAEFYLPEYGWIPVDTTAAEAGMRGDNISPQQRKIISDYFFGHMDPYRMVIQKDVDLIPYPTPKEGMFLLFAFQVPFGEDPAWDQDPNSVIHQHFTSTIEAFGY